MWVQLEKVVNPPFKGFLFFVYFRTFCKCIEFFPKARGRPDVSHPEEAWVRRMRRFLNAARKSGFHAK